MANTSARILRLLSLLGIRTEWPGFDLADRLEVSARTLRRDIDTLRELGYPIESVKGPGGGYRLGSAGKLPPLVLDEEQAIAIALSLQTTPATVTGINDAVARALTTLQQVMPAKLRVASESLNVTNLHNYWDFTAPPIDIATLQIVGSAIHTTRTLRFDFAPPTDTPRNQTMHVFYHLWRSNLINSLSGPDVGISSPDTAKMARGPPTGSIVFDPRPLLAGLSRP